MHPFLAVVRVGGVDRPLGSYGAMVALAIFVAGAVMVRAASRARCDVGATFAVLALTIAGALASAWLTYAIVELARTGTLDAIASGGGMVVYGALPGGLGAMIAASRWLRLPAWRILDLGVPGIAAAHAIGRLGCLLGGCCYGAPSELPWAIVYTHPFAPGAHPSVPRHPSPLYEAIALLALALAFALAPPRRPGSGERAAMYLGAYAIVRFAVELTRGDAVRGLWIAGLVSTSQILSALALIAAVVIARRARA